MKNVICMFLMIVSQVVEIKANCTPVHVVLGQVEPDKDFVVIHPHDAHYPEYFKKLIFYIKSGHIASASELINTLSQEQLNFQDCVRRTALMIAIEHRQEEIALSLVNKMNERGLLQVDAEWCNAYTYATSNCYDMPVVAHAIDERLKDSVGLNINI